MCTDHEAPCYVITTNLSPVSLSLLWSYIYLSTMFSNTFSLRSYCSVTDQVAHPYNTTDKITIL